MKHGGSVRPTLTRIRRQEDPASVKQSMAENPDAPQASATAPIIQGITPPKALNITHGNIAENWKNYKQVWQNYAIITNLKAQTEQYRVALFLHCIGPEALKVYNGMQFADETERNTLAKI